MTFKPRCGNCGNATRGEYTLDQCRRCWLALNSEEYQEEMGIKTARTCKHLGDPTGELVECPTCKARTRLRVFSCGVHGVCIPAKKIEGYSTCRGAECPNKEPIGE